MSPLNLVLNSKYVRIQRLNPKSRTLNPKPRSVNLKHDPEFGSPSNIFPAAGARGDIEVAGAIVRTEGIDLPEILVANCREAPKHGKITNLERRNDEISPSTPVITTHF